LWFDQQGLRIILGQDLPGFHFGNIGMFNWSLKDLIHMTVTLEHHQPSCHPGSLEELSSSAHQYFALVVKQGHLLPQQVFSPRQGQRFKRFDLLHPSSFVQIYQVHHAQWNFLFLKSFFRQGIKKLDCESFDPSLPDRSENRHYPLIAHVTQSLALYYYLAY
jgi:hypothetical protein